MSFLALRALFALMVGGCSRFGIGSPSFAADPCTSDINFGNGVLSFATISRSVRRTRHVLSSIISFKLFIDNPSINQVGTIRP